MLVRCKGFVSHTSQRDSRAMDRTRQREARQALKVATSNRCPDRRKKVEPVTPEWHRQMIAAYERLRDEGKLSYNPTEFIESHRRMLEDANETLEGEAG
jgi:hypothetical protein